MERPAHLAKSKEKDQIHSSVLWQGTKAALIGGSIGLFASLVAQRFSPHYRSLKFPFKISLVLGITTASFFTVAERAVMYADREFAKNFSIQNELGVDESSLLLKQQHELGHRKAWKDMIYKYRYYIIGYGWLTVAGATLIYQWKRRDIKSSQKLINARLTSQLLALLGFGAIASLSTSIEEEEEIDIHYDQIVNKRAV